MHSRPSRIYLNGFMGCGKSTIGPILAVGMGWQFMDLDDIIVASIGMPIAEYFTKEGEPAFRKVERRALYNSKDSSNHVIAVGGGALCSQKNLNWTKRQGCVVYLKVSVDELVSRLKLEQTTRPMMRGKKGELLQDDAVRERISSLLDSRAAFYEQAHLVIHTDGLSIEEVVHEIAKKVNI